MKYEIKRIKEPNGKLERKFYTYLIGITNNQNHTLFRLKRPIIDMVEELCRDAMTWTNKNNKKGKCELQCHGDGNQVIIHRMKKPSDILFKIIQINKNNNHGTRNQ